MIDLNANGMSDVWEQIYSDSALDPNADTDGDGVINRLEAIAASNPFDSNSVPKITATAFAGTNFSVTMPSALGKQYQLQSSQIAVAGGWSNWVTEAIWVARTGSVITLTAPAGVSAKFFRISISDVDTDGDGVNDWEEYQFGLDPMNQFSNGQLDSSGHPMNDYAYATGRLQIQNVITITATDPVTTQPDGTGPPTDLGVFTVTRGGFPLNAITVSNSLAVPGPGIAVENTDHAKLSRSLSFPAGTSSQTIYVTPLTNAARISPVVVTMSLLPGLGYTLGTASNASVVIYPSTTPTGTGLTGMYYTNSSSTYSSSANFNSANLKLMRVDPLIDTNWGSSATLPITNSGYYTVRWTGQVQPQYSELYYFDAYTADGLKLWVNDQLIIDNWVSRSSPADAIGTITLQGGVRYNIKMEYFRNNHSAQAHLNWYSPSQAKQIIPTSRLYPTNVPPGPAIVTTPINAVAFLGQPFALTNTAANSGTNFTAVGLPPGLGFNPTNGVISGVPNLAGLFQITITASNSVGVGASVINLQVIDTGTSVTREVWLGAPGVNVSDIPLATPATLTNTLGTLEGITGYGTNYGERISGFLTAPITGNYFFWLAASDSAELWVSNDSEPANKVKRASVLSGGATAPRQWYSQPNQKSGWLSLIAGQRYYLEVLHKAGPAGNDNVSVGWLQDPTGTNITAAGVVPGYVLGRYFAPPPSFIPGTLYVASLHPEAGVVSSGMGSATLRVSADGSQAVLNFSYSGLTSPETSEHIHNDQYLTHPSGIIFDIDENPDQTKRQPQPDGSYLWPIVAVGGLSVADINELIKEGDAYVNIHTVNFPNGEIRGNFTPVDGSQTFTPPPSAPSWTDDHANANAASRFLLQATFGPSPTEVSKVQTLGYSGWISTQLSLPPSHHLPLLLSNENPDLSNPYQGTIIFNDWWQQSVTAPDQLRQRVAFALSEIMVVSQQGTLQDNGLVLSSYYDALLDNAFGNFRALLKAITLTPAMGLFLNMQGSDVGSIITGVHANENYAREINQLFSIGLYRMWPDGTLVMNSQGSLVPTYDQNVVMGFASVFTGWNYNQTNQSNGHLPSIWNPPHDYFANSRAYTNPMVLVPTHHELGTKRLLDNVILPQAWGLQANTTTTNCDSYCSQDLESAMDSIFYNQTVGPFVCRQLIQRLVTSNPSRGYLYRAVQAFNDNGSGVRGDMQAVINAILLDYEARSTVQISQPTYGKQREPLLRVTGPARAFPPPAPITGTYTQNGYRQITNITSSPHRLGTTNSTIPVVLTFTDTSGQTAPSPSSYSLTYNATVINSNTFTVNAPEISTGTYGQTNGTITVNISGHGLGTNYSTYLVFLSGLTNEATSNGVFQVLTIPDANHFTVATSDTNTISGTNKCLIPKWTGGGYIVSGTNVTVGLIGNHGLHPGDNVYIYFSYGSPPNGQYQVVTVPDATHFTIVFGTLASLIPAQTPASFKHR